MKNYRKFLCPSQITFGQFTETVRRKLQLDPSQALFFFVPDLISNEVVIADLYEKKKNQEDGFLVSLFFFKLLKLFNVKINLYYYYNYI